MKQLPLEFSRNDINYKILERTETRYFASLHSTESNALISYETGRIHLKKAHKEIIHGREANFTDREVISNDDQFGYDPFECCYPPKLKDLVYQSYLASLKYTRPAPKHQIRKPQLDKVI